MADNVTPLWPTTSDLPAAHDVVIPLATTGPAAPSPAVADAPFVTNCDHGQFPAAPETQWLSVSIFTHPERMDDVIGNHLPRLIWSLDRPRWWVVRYRSPQEPDHLRLRLHTPGGRVSLATVVPALTAWFTELRRHGVTGRVIFDTYYPEVGRYGGPDALAAAETVFGADSVAVLYGIQHLTGAMPPESLAAAGMVHIVRALLGDDTAASRWLIDRTPVMVQAESPHPLGRDAAYGMASLALAETVTYPSSWPHELTQAWRHRASALRDYARLLPSPVPDRVVDSLLHMHHNRVVGPDPLNEHLARCLARAAALTARDRIQAAVIP